MDDRKHLLWLLLGLFAVVTILLAWSMIHRSLNTFRSGTAPSNTPTIVAPEPKQPPIRATDPARGASSTSAITIMEFADFTCQYCRATEPEIQSLLAAYPDQLRIVWRDLPITSDRPDAMLAATAGRCANEQGRFWEMHDQLFQMTSIDLTSLQDAASQIKLQTGPFMSCLQSGRYVADIQADIELAKSHNLQGAPTFFVGGSVLSGYVKATELQWAMFKARIFN